MELTNELKARFFALYWGQDVAFCKISSRIQCVGLGRFGGHLTTDNYLLLRPLSSITEEEAKDYFERVGWVRPKINVADLINGEMLEEGDYLRSKGFALPFMGISVEEMEKQGWIKLKTE